MPFANGPVLSYIGNGHYQTVGPTDYVGADEVVHIPSDFPTDLASIPRAFWALMPPHGAYEKAAVAHDYLCDELNRHHRQIAAWKASRIAEKPKPPQINAVDTDGLFRRICREAAVPAPIYWELWWGVRLGALFNPARRKGWLRTAVPVLLITVVNLAALYGAWWAAAWTFANLPWNGAP